MPATGSHRAQQFPATWTSFLACALALSACQVSKDGTGYIGDGGRRDGQEAGSTPPNVARVDGGDVAAGRDLPPAADTATPDTRTTDASAPAPAPDAPPDLPPPPVCETSERRCRGMIPESCGGGGWVPGPACPFVCAAGVCVGECVPGATRCSDKVAQLCAADGKWATAQQCPFLCAAGACTGVCAPRSVICTGARRRTCRADASGYDDMDCPAPPGGTAICREATCGFDCTDPGRRFRCGNACCACMRHEDCPANNVCTAGACKFQAPVIHITGGFYGRNCQGMGFPMAPPDARPDRTAHLAQACEGKPSCDYDVDHLVIGDPAVGCGKVYEATWQCVSGATRTSHAATLPAEASYGPLLKIVCPGS